jgi:hypothetical protein
MDISYSLSLIASPPACSEVPSSAVLVPVPVHPVDIASITARNSVSAPVILMFFKSLFLNSHYSSPVTIPHREELSSSGALFQIIVLN